MRMPPIPPPLPLLPGWGRRRDQGGVALLAVLWVIAGAGTAVTVGLAAVRDGVATSSYRTEFTKARWSADGCLALFRANVERAIRGGAARAGISDGASDLWVNPGRALPAGCTITLDPPPDGPLDVNAAPNAALLTLPGFDSTVVDAVVRFRAYGRRFEDLDQFIGALPAELRAGVAAHYAELVGRAVFAPPAWVVTAHGVIAARKVPVVSERWVRAGSRIAITRRELW